MVANKKVTGTASSIPTGIVFGCGISLLISIVGAMVFAKLIDAQILQESAIGYSAMAVILIASFLGAWLAAAKIKHRKAFVCILCGAVYYAVLLGMTALLFGGQYQGMGATALLILAGSVCAILLELPSGKKGGMHKRKIAHR